MKTNKILVAGVTTAVILSLATTSIYAYGGNGQGGGQGMGKNLTQEQRIELQSMTMEERQEYMKTNGIERGQGRGQGKGSNSGGHGGKGADHNPGDMIADIPASDLTDKEKEILSYGYSEEMVARDAYNYLYELYGEEVFKRIADSEQKHMDAVKVLLDRYDLDAPTGYGDLQSTFDTLKTQGEIGLKDALEVGIQIEILDIEDIEDSIRNTDNDDFKVVFTNIGGASYNHLRAFLNSLDNNNLETDIDYSEFLSGDDLDTKGPLAYKLAERLESQGIELPNQVTSDEMKNRKGNSAERGQSNAGNKGQNRSSQVNKGKQGQYNSTLNLKAKYKNTYEAKYGSLISKMDDTKLNIFIEKVDGVIEKVNNGNYSETTREKYNAMLGALRDIATDNLDENEDLDIDSLFE